MFSCVVVDIFGCVERYFASFGVSNGFCMEIGTMLSSRRHFLTGTDATIIASAVCE